VIPLGTVMAVAAGNGIAAAAEPVVRAGVSGPVPKSLVDANVVEGPRGSRAGSAGAAGAAASTAGRGVSIGAGVSTFGGGSDFAGVSTGGGVSTGFGSVSSLGLCSFGGVGRISARFGGGGAGASTGTSSAMRTKTARDVLKFSPTATIAAMRATWMTHDAPSAVSRCSGDICLTMLPSRPPGDDVKLARIVASR